MRKPARDVAVKIPWKHYKALKDESLETGKPIKRLLVERLEQVDSGITKEGTVSCPLCSFTTKRGPMAKARLGRHVKAKHGKSLSDIS